MAKAAHHVVEQASSLFSRIDVDGSGSIEIEEFLAHMMGSGLTHSRILELWRQVGGDETSVSKEGFITEVESAQQKGTASIVADLQVGLWSCSCLCGCVLCGCAA